MCGIVGIVNPTLTGDALIKSMIWHLHHCGPDDQKVSARISAGVVLRDISVYRKSFHNMSICAMN